MSKKNNRNKHKKKRRNIKTKKTMEWKKYFAARNSIDGETRGGRSLKTTQRQQRVNLERSKEWFLWLVETNFQGGDKHVKLGYALPPGALPRSDEQVKDDVRVFLRNMRAAYKRTGREFKFIYVYERGESGGLHVHMIINRIDDKTIQRYWKYALVTSRRLDDSGDYEALCEYLSKQFGEILGDSIKLRYSHSRNLEKPVVTYEYIDGDFEPGAILDHKETGYIVKPDSYKLTVDERGNISESVTFIKINNNKTLSV